MGSQSRRFRASKIVVLELFHLGWLLLLYLGFLIQSADHDHTFRYANSGAFPWEHWRSEVITIANPGAFSLEKTTSEVITIANSTSSSNIFDGRCTACGNYSSETDYGNMFLEKYADPGGFFLEQKTSVVFTLPNQVHGFWDGQYSVLGNYSKEAKTFPVFANWNLSRTFNLDFARSYCREAQSSTLTSCTNVTRASTLSENGSCEKCSSVIRASTSSENSSCEKYSLVIALIFCVITIFALIAIRTWKRIRNVILFKSNNELDALFLEESDLDESYLDDQILYENLLEEAELVSEGSSGKVFKVRFLELDCAMKVFHSNARMDFRKESITLLNLSHPHVVKFFCSFRKSFVIMELMDEDLYSFITKIRERRIDYDMPLEVALDVMLQIAEGMSYLHHQGIAHQDLKSLNILLKLRGEFDDPHFQIIAKVADLGSARRFDPRYPTSFVLSPHMNIGTRSWRAPELFHPRGGFWTRFLGLNPRVLPKPLDIYGFAVICSELLTKQIPFSNDKDLRVAVFASKVREGHRPALPSTGCPEGLLALIKDCWHKDPVLRPEFHEVRTRLFEVKSSWMSRGERPES